MPSAEKQGQQPGEHTGGVGSLPGSKDEQEVAVLPEERVTKISEMDRPEHPEGQGDSTDKTKTDTGTLSVGVGAATDPLKKETQSRVSVDFHGWSNPHTSIPKPCAAVSSTWRPHHSARASCSPSRRRRVSLAWYEFGSRSYRRIGTRRRFEECTFHASFRSSASSRPPLPRVR